MRRQRAAQVGGKRRAGVWLAALAMASCGRVSFDGTRGNGGEADASSGGSASELGGAVADPGGSASELGGSVFYTGGSGPGGSRSSSGGGVAAGGVSRDPSGGSAGVGGTLTSSSGASGQSAGGGHVSGTGGGGAGGSAGGSPTILTGFLIDNVRLQRSSVASSAGGAGGASPTDGGAGGVAQVSPDFLLTFDAGLGLLTKNANGFSPGPGNSGGPPIVALTTLTLDPVNGHPGGAARIAVPFTVATQQADFSEAFSTPQDLTGYELLADVNMISSGSLGDCASAWLYVYGASGYANAQYAEPALGQTNHLVQGQWTTIHLDLNGPYGFHTSSGFTPTSLSIWGLEVNTWGCP